MTVILRTKSEESKIILLLKGEILHCVQNDRMRGLDPCPL